MKLTQKKKKKNSKKERMENNHGSAVNFFYIAFLFTVYDNE